MDGLSPWKKLEQQLAKKYSTDKVGRKPYPLSMMLRVHVMQPIEMRDKHGDRDIDWLIAHRPSVRSKLAKSKPLAKAEISKASVRAKVGTAFTGTSISLGTAKCDTGAWKRTLPAFIY